jgi:hypothetical protein
MAEGDNCPDGNCLGHLDARGHCTVCDRSFPEGAYLGSLQPGAWTVASYRDQGQCPDCPGAPLVQVEPVRELSRSLRVWRPVVPGSGAAADAAAAHAAADVAMGHLVLLACTACGQVQWHLEPLTLAAALASSAPAPGACPACLSSVRGLWEPLDSETDDHGLVAVVPMPLLIRNRPFSEELPRMRPLGENEDRNKVRELVPPDIKWMARGLGAVRATVCGPCGFIEWRAERLDEVDGVPENLQVDDPCPRCPCPTAWRLPAREWNRQAVSSKSLEEARRQHTFVERAVTFIDDRDGRLQGLGRLEILVCPGCGHLEWEALNLEELELPGAQGVSRPPPAGRSSRRQSGPYR